jgi:glycosyltransferase involved in cell wall biosynthesis
MKHLISVVVITHNEENMIADCLSSVQWADDIIVVDAYSKDHTVELSKKITSKVFQKKWEGYVSAKQYGMERAVHDWILWLDADERVPEDLAVEIQNTIANTSDLHTAYEIGRRAFFLGKWIRHCGWYPGYVLRLFRKGKVRFTKSRVHEHLECDGSVGRMKHDLLHYTDENLYHYFIKLNRYTSLAAKDLDEAGYRFKLFDILIRPVFLFCKMYFIKGGFLDGMHGLILSALSAAYVFCKYAKIWELHQKKIDTVRRDNHLDYQN